MGLAKTKGEATSDVPEAAMRRAARAFLTSQEGGFGAGFDVNEALPSFFEEGGGTHWGAGVGLNKMRCCQCGLGFEGFESEGDGEEGGDVGRLGRRWMAREALATVRVFPCGHACHWLCSDREVCTLCFAKSN